MKSENEKKDDKATEGDTKEKDEKNKSGKGILYGAAVVIGAAGGVGFYFYKKKKSAGVQK